jgi:tyrosyl-tRNA synthetase
MSKSTGNIVPINTGADDMYGKLMSIPDLAMGKYMRLATRWSPQEIVTFEKELGSGTIHPRDAKMKLAREITGIFYGEAGAQKAEETFVRTFQQKETPDEIPEYDLRSGQTVLDVILDAKMSSSKSEARRLFDQKGVRLDGETIERGDVPFPHSGVLQVGKRKFLRVK